MGWPSVTLDDRRRFLAGLSEVPAAVERALGYCEALPVSDTTLPLPDEAHVADWRRYQAACPPDDVLGFLAARLPQLRVPIRAGVSQTPAYAAAVRRGEPESFGPTGDTLALHRPERLRLLIHEHPAGALPVLSTAERADFELLWCALGCRSEPTPVSPSVNAQMIAGLINWDRVHGHRARWQAAGGGAWPAEMGRVAQFEPELFYDRLMLVCEAPYSSISAERLGLAWSEDEWLARSAALRVEHEFTHYATKRVCGAMRLNLLDELIADTMGTTHALGEFRAAWFLEFIGLANWPEVTADARAHTYTVGLDAETLALVCKVTRKAAHGIEQICRDFPPAADRARFLLALVGLGLDTLARSDASALFADRYQAAAPEAALADLTPEGRA